MKAYQKGHHSPLRAVVLGIYLICFLLRTCQSRNEKQGLRHHHHHHQRRQHHQGYWKQVFYLEGGPSWQLASEKTQQPRRSVRQTSDQGTDNNITWPYKMSADVEGLITLGGLHMIHERNNIKTCGPIMAQGGVQAMETMLYTIDHINQQEWWLKDVPLGALILDDCDTDTYGLEQAVDFIKGSIANIDDDAVKCWDGSTPESQNKKEVISGVVGAASSVTSIQVANLLRLFKIPQISFFSTSPELSNKQRFEYFSRTIPSDHYQTMAMAKIIERLGWKYMSIIYEESNYGIKAFEELERLLSNRSICVAVKEKLTKDSGVAGAGDYDHIVEKLMAKPKARGVIIFGSDQEVAGLMRAVKRQGVTGKFSWIGSDGWSARALVSEGNEAEVEGTLSIQPQANPVIGFEEYFLNLTVQNNPRNPWFAEFWEDHFKCRYPGALATPYNQNYNQTCSGNERLTRENTKFEAQLQFVSDAVMAFAHAFKDMHAKECGPNFIGLCDKMTSINGETLLNFLRNVSFTGLTGDKFKFNQHGDGPARYNIIHYKQISRGVYKWINVGYFHDGQMELKMEELQFQLDHPTHPISICSLPCNQGQMKKYIEGESCCWTCHQCGQYEILHPKDETQCKSCPNGTSPDPQHLVCVELPEEYLHLNSYWAIGSITFAIIGIVLATTVLAVFIRNNDTPVVRASGRELSYVLLCGLLMCYGLTFILMQKPNTLICGIQEFMIGLCFSIVYGALLTKTNRISRIFNASKQSAQRPNFISPKSQLCICSGIVLIQVLINVIWFLISPPEAMHHHPTREDNLLVCKASINASYMIAFSYPILLVIICTVYAVLTRKIPEAFNESKFIGFSMYTTCIIWLAFIPIYFTTSQHVALRITSMSVTISLSATVTIACLFIPKLYIILLHPEKNVRQSMMNHSKYQKSTHQSVIKSNGPTNSNGGLPVTQICNGTIEVKESVPLVCNKSKITACSTCTSTKTKVVKKQVETSCQTEEEPEMVLRKRKILDVSTQTASRWVQISLNSPPLSLTQEVPDVVL